MSYRNDLWEVATTQHGVVTVTQAEDVGVPAVEVRKLASRGALRPWGNGVYTHCAVSPTRYTEPMIAVSLAGEGAFLHRESALLLHGLGQFNPRSVLLGTRRRVRRTLPPWMSLEYRPEVTEADILEYEGVWTTSINRALRDMWQRMPTDRWDHIVEVALRRDLLRDEDVPRWGEPES